MEIDTSDSIHRPVAYDHDGFVDNLSQSSQLGLLINGDGLDVLGTGHRPESVMSDLLLVEQVHQGGTQTSMGHAFRCPLAGTLDGWSKI